MSFYEIASKGEGGSAVRCKRTIHEDSLVLLGSTKEWGGSPRGNWATEQLLQVLIILRSGSLLSEQQFVLMRHRRAWISLFVCNDFSRYEDFVKESRDRMILNLSRDAQTVLYAPKQLYIEVIGFLFHPFDEIQILWIKTCNP